MSVRLAQANPRAGSAITCELVATGYGYPSERVDNDAYFSRCRFRVTEDPARLVAETRMKSRLWCKEDENTLTMARAAVAGALESQPHLRDEIDLLVVSSGTTMPVVHPPDASRPGMGDLAPLLLRDLDRGDAVGLDLKGVYCTGFVRALEVADSMLRAGGYRAALVVSAEQGSRFSVAESNRTSFCFLAGDAAGAVVLKARKAAPRTGVVDVLGYIDPTKLDWVGVGPDARSIINRGSKVAEAAHGMFVECGQALLRRNGLSASDVDWLLPLQTHVAVVDNVRAALGFKESQLVWFGDTTGLSGSASIPACLAEQKERGLIKKGDLVLSVAVAAGLNCGGALFYA